MKTHGWNRSLNVVLLAMLGMVLTGCQSIHSGATHPFATMFRGQDSWHEKAGWEPCSWNEQRAMDDEKSGGRIRTADRDEVTQSPQIW
ncbi:MAG: hypothetical protein R3C49_04810 [Planctomycetaceae bacterium]